MQTCVIVSKYLRRKVPFDIYHSFYEKHKRPEQLVLFNDGQDLLHSGLSSLLNESETHKLIPSMMVVGIHAGRERKQEYGIAGYPDFKNRGNKAAVYTQFILEELLPFLDRTFCMEKSVSNSFAGFSLGGLSAFDIVWNHPDIFSKAGVFSGSLWWRNKDLTDGYKDDSDRIILPRIREGAYHRGLKFFFECGTEDEKEDRNQNGIIDVIDDTLDVIDELIKKGYSYPGDIIYHEIPGGKHEVQTWKQTLPAFFQFLSED